MLRMSCSPDCQKEQGEPGGCCPEVHSVITCMKEVVSREVASELVSPGYMGCVVCGLHTHLSSWHWRGLGRRTVSSRPAWDTQQDTVIE